MNSEAYSPFTAWLDEATDDLPESAATALRSELEAHCEDSLADYLADGFAEPVAREKVLDNLGPAGQISRRLKDVYRGPRVYRMAAVTSLLLVIVLFGMPVLIHALEISEYSTVGLFAYDITNVISTTLIIVNLWALKRLLEWRMGIERLEVVFKLMVAGVAAQPVLIILSNLLYGSDAYAQWDASIFRAPGPVAALIVVLALISRLVASAAIGWLAVRLLKDNIRLYGLGKLIAAVLLAFCYGLASAGVYAHLGVLFAAETSYIVVMFAHAVTWPLLTLLFFRAVTRPRLTPAAYA